VRPRYRQCFVNVSGEEKPDWVYVLVRLKRDGTPDYRFSPRWRKK
jgi:hypothetical protein